MPTKPIEAASTPAAEAVDEAIRTISGVSQRGAEEAKRVIATSNTLVTDRLATGQKLFRAWTDGLQAILKASFEAQNTILATGPTFFEAVYSVNKSVVGTVPEVAKQYQRAWLSAFESTVASTEKLLVPPAR